MYYRLNDDYKLCGWNGLPFAIRGPQKDYHYDREQYRFVLQCDGVTEITDGELSTEQLALRDELLECGMITSSNERLSKLSLSQQYNKYDSPYIMEMTWGVTGKCNYQCLHCFMSAPKGIHPEPTWNMCVHVLDEFSSCGIRDLVLTGGEPFFRKDISKLLVEMKKRNIRVNGVLSNGSLITDEILEAFRENDMHPLFSISFDGIYYHDKIRGVPGARIAAEKAIKKVIGHGCSVSCNMCLNKNNAGELMDTVNYLDALGVEFIHISSVNEEGLWKEFNKKNSLTYDEQLQVLLEYIPHYYKGRVKTGFVYQGWFTAKGFDGEYSSGHLVNHEQETDFSKKPLCSSPKLKAFLNAEGMLSPCIPMDGKMPDNKYMSIYERPLKELFTDSAWTEFNKLTKEDYLQRNVRCKSCEYRLQCNFGCPAAGFIDHDRFWGIDEKNCFFLKNRCAEKILKVARYASLQKIKQKGVYV